MERGRSGGEASLEELLLDLCKGLSGVLEGYSVKPIAIGDLEEVSM